MKNKSLVSRRSVVFNYIVMIIFCLAFLFPLYFFFTNAFKIGKYISTNPFYLTVNSFTLDNLKNAFVMMEYLQAFKNSFIVLLISSAIMIIFGSMAAYIIVIVGGRFLNRLYFAVIALMTIPVYVAMIPLSKLLANLGLINSYLGLACVYVAFALPFVIFLYVGNMKTIPVELSEASTIDGCNLYQTYLFIYMPLLKMVTGTVLILRGMYIWNDILIPLITVRSGYLQTLPQRLVAFSTDNGTRWELMFGAAFLVSVPAVIIFLLLQKTFIQGIVEGSVKG